MPMLLEDLAEETSASNLRTADRLDAEARELDSLRPAVTSLEELRQKAVESARQATDYALSQVPQAEGFWRSALTKLRNNPSGDDAERILGTLRTLSQSVLRLFRAARSLCEVAEQLGTTAEGLDELKRAEERFEELAAEAKQALEHRASAWQPTDPARLALGLQLAREGQTIKADDARKRFRRSGG